MKKQQKQQKQSEPMAVVRPDSRNGLRDYHIPLTEAERLFDEGKLARDITNGGYCPIR